MPQSFGVIAILAGFAKLVSAKAAFFGDFELSDLIVESPFEARPNSTESSSVSFFFVDQDLPEKSPVHCSIEWAVGLSPPSMSLPGTCDDPSVNAWLPEGTYNGTENLLIQFSHVYTDDSVGEYPYNVLTKFGALNLTYPTTQNYECDTEAACCKSCDGTSMVAPVTSAIA